MKSSMYYDWRCAVSEMFYETLIEEGYTIGQAASRGLVEFRGEVLGGGQKAMVVLSVLFSRVARHEPTALANYLPELRALQALSQKSRCWKQLAPGEHERMQEDVRFVLEKAAKL